MNNKILLVEDDVAISEMVENYLQKEGFHIVTALRGNDALEKFFNNSFDLVILDIMLPQISGIEILKKIREVSSVPVLIMSAKDSDVDKVVGFELGADDYIPKPFSMVELLARVKASIRRATQYSDGVKNNIMEEENEVLKFGDIIIDLNNFLVEKDNEKIQLTSKEFEILKLFINNPKRVFTKSQIYNLIWNDDYIGDENLINVHMARLRKKIEQDPSNPKYIKTLWGIGYKLGEF